MLLPGWQLPEIRRYSCPMCGAATVMQLKLIAEPWALWPLTRFSVSLTDIRALQPGHNACRES